MRMSLCMIFFLFFKQKTAYEMRISDWSSDVCSSDLACVGDSALLSLDDVALATAGGNLPGLERALGRSFSEGNAPVTVLRAVARHLQRVHAVAGAGGAVDEAMRRLRPPVFWKRAAAFKIGRASCRERVCQYV